MLKNIVWSDPSREHDLPQGWRAHTAPSERGSKVLQFDMQVIAHGENTSRKRLQRFTYSHLQCLTPNDSYY